MSFQTCMIFFIIQNKIEDDIDECLFNDHSVGSKTPLVPTDFNVKKQNNTENFFQNIFFLDICTGVEQ